MISAGQLPGENFPTAIRMRERTELIAYGMSEQRVCVCVDKQNTSAGRPACAIDHPLSFTFDPRRRVSLEKSLWQTEPMDSLRGGWRE